nr:uncharacterized protein LOC123495030 [Aegilops tauschii subsp. strangulata]
MPHDLARTLVQRRHTQSLVRASGDLAPPPASRHHPASRPGTQDEQRTRTLTSFFQPQSTDSIVTETGPSIAANDDVPHVTPQLKPGDTEPDPGKRIPIENLDPDITDLARREYISKGPCQPTDHVYERKWVGKGFSSFHGSWSKSSWLVGI